MKMLRLLLITAALALAVSCEKPVSEADRNAEVEREVQQRLAAERQADERKQLDQQQADLAAREHAVAEREAAAAQSPEEESTPPPTAPADEQEETETASASNERPARSYDTFYRKLEPYGAWRETDTYGYVWQPRAAQDSRDWRPYTDGRWAYTDAGWTWVSSEPFGWATYHYGRWTRLRGVGWVWVPGEEWAPAWVSWRSSDQHVGWAPLPPEARFERGTGIKKWADSYYDIGADEYVFIPNEDIGAENIERAAIPVARNVTIVNETTNVTNITYNNTTIVNEGPNYERLRQHSRRPVERLQLQREYNIAEDRTPQATVRGNVLAIMTPHFTGRATHRPRNVGAPIQQATVERNWVPNANEAEARRARTKMQAEATPPPNAPPKQFVKPAIVPGTPPPIASPTPVRLTTPAPTIPATPSRRPSATAIPATASPTMSPRRGPRATPTPVATPTATATATPATPRPTPKSTPTPLPTAKPATTPKPTPVPTVRAKPSATPIQKPTAPAAIKPVVTPTLTPIPPEPARTKAPSRAPLPPRPTGTATPDAAGKDATATGGSRRGQDVPPPRGAGRIERPGMREKPPEKIGGAIPSATIAPPAVSPPAVAPRPTPVTAPGKIRVPVPPAPAGVTPTPTPVPSPDAKNPHRGGRGGDKPARGKPTPGGEKEP